MNFLQPELLGLLNAHVPLSLLLVAFLLVQQLLSIFRHHGLQVDLFCFIVSAQILILANVVVHGEELDRQLPLLKSSDRLTLPNRKLLLDFLDCSSQVLLCLHRGATHHRCITLLGLEDLLKVLIVPLQDFDLSQRCRLGLLCFFVFRILLLVG